MNTCLAIRRRSERDLPRFKVRYRQAERLVAEVARCLNGGCSALDVRVPMQVGSRLAFELSADLVPSVEVLAEVLSADPLADGRFRLRVLYTLEARGGLDEAVGRVLRSKDTEPMRRSPRLPVHLPASGDYGEPAYLVRDLSLFGGGIELNEEHLPFGLRVGMPVKLQLSLPGDGCLSPRGTIVWLHAPSPEGELCQEPGFGVEFSEPLRGGALGALERILRLETSPLGVRLSLGFRALAGF